MFNKRSGHHSIITGDEGNRFESITMSTKPGGNHIKNHRRVKHKRNIKFDKNPEVNGIGDSYMEITLRRFPIRTYVKDHKKFVFIQSDKDKIDKLAKEKHKFKLWH